MMNNKTRLVMWFFTIAILIDTISTYAALNWATGLKEINPVINALHNIQPLAIFAYPIFFVGVVMLLLRAESAHDLKIEARSVVLTIGVFILFAGIGNVITILTK